MQSTFWTALATSTVAAIVTSCGIYTIRRFAGWGQRNTSYLRLAGALGRGRTKITIRKHKTKA